MQSSTRPEALPALILPRRELLALAALGSLAQLTRAGASPVPEEPQVLDFARFLELAVPRARELVGDTSGSGQDRYLHALAALASGLREVPQPQMRETTSKGASARTFLGVNECEAPFTVLHWRLDPGARIGLHPHLYGNVLTLCLEGEVRIQNFELVGERDFDTKESFRVRRSNDQQLLPGRMNLVNLEHGYVHGFCAGPAGARGLDLTTRLREKRSTPTLEVGAQALDEARGIFEGRWRQD
ncbi:MAG: hypothetical protein IPJ19_11590 [Planctomycetes bacterium]|nr:hypothetical protein [Planctomycetota bacterium]